MRFRLGVLSSSLAAAGFALCACTSPTYLFMARGYLAAQNCLVSEVALDVIAGDDPGRACSPRCLTARAGASAGTVSYVAQTCGLLPPDWREVNGPSCDAVLAANPTCSVPGADAGAD